MRPHASPNAVRKEGCDKDPQVKQFRRQPTSSQQRHTGQSSSSSSQHGETLGKIHTSTLNFEKNPSIELQTLSGEDEDLAESWKDFSLLESPVRHQLSTDVHVFSDSVWYLGNNKTRANQAWATSMDPTTFTGMYCITGRPVQFHWHTFSRHTASQIMRENQTFLGSTEPCGFKGRIKFMSMFNDIAYWVKGNSKHLSQTQQRLPNARSNSS